MSKVQDYEAREALGLVLASLENLIEANKQLRNRVKNLEKIVADRVITPEEKAASAARWRNSRSK